MQRAHGPAAEPRSPTGVAQVTMPPPAKPMWPHRQRAVEGEEERGARNAQHHLAAGGSEWEGGRQQLSSCGHGACFPSWLRAGDSQRISPCVFRHTPAHECNPTSG